MIRFHQLPPWSKAMASFAVDLVLRLAGARGHIPRFDDFPPLPAPATSAGYLARVLTVIGAIFAALSLAVWGLAWLSLRLL
jgi:hypothetical protein